MHRTFLITLLISASTLSFAKDATPVSLNSFITSACAHDSTFQELLIDTLRLRYAEKLALTPEELLIDVTGEFGVTLGGEIEPEAQVMLTQLFPKKGSTLKGSVRSTKLASGTQRNELEVIYSVDILRNAFGRIETVQSGIVGLESDIVRYQILQAYELYLKELVLAYYNWLQAYGEHLSALASVKEGHKLLQNIQAKKHRYIANQVDVDKARLQVINKAERVRATLETYQKQSIRIAHAMGKELTTAISPDTINAVTFYQKQVEENLSSFSFDSTRTAKIYAALHISDSLKIEVIKDGLQPSLSLYGGINVSDDSPSENAKLMAGLTLSFPMYQTHKKAEIETIKIDQRQTSLSSKNVQSKLNMKLTQIQYSMGSKRKAIVIAEEKRALSESILKAESEDYLYGRVSLNDLIQALNTLQTNRLNSVNTRIELARLWVEALDLSDQLITSIEK